MADSTWRNAYIRELLEYFGIKNAREIQQDIVQIRDISILENVKEEVQKFYDEKKEVYLGEELAELNKNKETFDEIYEIYIDIINEKAKRNNEKTSNQGENEEHTTSINESYEKEDSNIEKREEIDIMIPIRKKKEEPTNIQEESNEEPMTLRREAENTIQEVENGIRELELNNNSSENTAMEKKIQLDKLTELYRQLINVGKRLLNEENKIIEMQQSFFKEGNVLQKVAKSFKYMKVSEVLNRDKKEVETFRVKIEYLKDKIKLLYSERRRELGVLEIKNELQQIKEAIEKTSQNIENTEVKIQNFEKEQKENIHNQYDKERRNQRSKQLDEYMEEVDEIKKQEEEIIQRLKRLQENVYVKESDRMKLDIQIYTDTCKKGVKKLEKLNKRIITQKEGIEGHKKRIEESKLNLLREVARKKIINFDDYKKKYEEEDQDDNR